MSIKDFPINPLTIKNPLGGSSFHPGITLLDYFAGRSLAGFRASELGESASAENVAGVAYEDAVEMLRERERVIERIKAETEAEKNILRLKNGEGKK